MIQNELQRRLFIRNPGTQRNEAPARSGILPCRLMWCRSQDTARSQHLETQGSAELLGCLELKQSAGSADYRDQTGDKAWFRFHLHGRGLGSGRQNGCMCKQKVPAPHSVREHTNQPIQQAKIPVANGAWAFPLSVREHTLILYVLLYFHIKKLHQKVYKK
jgi:hypothetical protein